MIATIGRTWRTVASSPGSAASAVFLLVLAALALLAPVITPYDPLALGDVPFSPPSFEHWLGTDQLGRDILTRIIYGARISLLIAGVGVGVALVVGTGVGLAAGYLGGAVDATLSRVTDVMFCLPDILLALVVMAVLGPGFDRIALAIAIVYTPIFARVCRGSALRVRRETYIEAARAAGCGHTRIVLRHVLPNLSGPLIVQTTLSLAFAVLAESALSFLGLSGETDAPSWGLILRQGKDFMEIAWWVAVFPGLAITFTVLGFNVLGDALARAAEASHGR